MSQIRSESGSSNLFQRSVFFFFVFLFLFFQFVDQFFDHLFFEIDIKTQTAYESKEF